MGKKNKKHLEHLVLIPDGDRRWAKENGVPAAVGHQKGAENIENMIKVCQKNDIHYLTMWGFSTENWNRGDEAVAKLMKLFMNLLTNKADLFIKNKVHFKHIGRKDRLSSQLMNAIDSLEKKTAKFDKWTAIVALDYGGQDEIARATKKIARLVKAGELQIEDITAESFYNYLDTAGIPDPDLLIRTSGEQRTSGVMPYQGTYAELKFVSVMFPAFTQEMLQEAIDDYYGRERRFGSDA